MRLSALYDLHKIFLISYDRNGTLDILTNIKPRFEVIGSIALLLNSTIRYV